MLLRGGGMAVLANIHPGDVLREEFIAPMGLTVREVTNATGIPQGDLVSLVEARCQIDPDTARRLSQFFGTSVQFWLGLQTDYDTEVAQCKA